MGTDGVFRSSGFFVLVLMMVWWVQLVELPARQRLENENGECLQGRGGLPARAPGVWPCHSFHMYPRQTCPSFVYEKYT
jgi:hypothetical protein